MALSPINLLGLPRDELEDYFVSTGQPSFRAVQLMRWLYHQSVLVPDEMTDLSQSLRQHLQEHNNFSLPGVVSEQYSSDGTAKWLLDVGNGQNIETVFIPEKNRGTLCISSQVGCAMDCPFCATGQQGFNRNLTAAEIIGQVVLATQALAQKQDDLVISNIVFMGMGEPLANIREVLRACSVLTDDHGFGLSRRRVTVSTSGLVPQMERLSSSTSVALAVSLHSSDNELRNELVPINRRHPIEELLQACWDYVEKTRSRDVTFEYIMLKGINDSVQDAKGLAKLLVGRPAKVNLIPFNPVPGLKFERSEQDVIDAFRKVLLDKGIMTVTRRPRGEDIDAACGQLAGQFDNRVLVPLARKLVHSVEQV
jgi:23S rRNA (adenine2503-C2)-methyltransferase